MATYEELREETIAAGGLLATEMIELKEAQNSGRLGIHVRNAISDKLESLGLGHLPDDLPPNQGDEVRLYQLGTPLAKVIKAVSDPSEDGDDLLRKTANSDAEGILSQIRQIVCE